VEALPYVKKVKKNVLTPKTEIWYQRAPGSKIDEGFFPGRFFVCEDLVTHKNKRNTGRERTHKKSMYSLNQLKTLVSCGRDPARSLPFRRGFLLIPLILVCFAFSPQTRAGCGSPDPGCPVGNLAEGYLALTSNSGSAYSTAIGAYSLLSNSNGSFNTAVGAGTLLLNTTAVNGTAVGAAALLSNNGANNTAVGSFALFSNTGNPDPNVGSGVYNNAVGANALVSNTTGSSNNALGESALFNCQIGSGNTAVGDTALGNDDSDGLGFGSANTAVGAGALFTNIDGDSNNAVGFNALGSLIGDSTGDTGNFNNAMGVDALANATTGEGNVGIGDSAGGNTVTGGFNIYVGFAVGGTADESNTIRIGDTLDTGCFIGGISGVIVAGGDPVVVDANGQLGVAAAGSPLSKNELLKQQHLVQELKATTERQAATIALQEGQIKALTASLKQQGELIQKVSAQLEMVRPTPRVVENR
jgi:hypothetical protein